MLKKFYPDEALRFRSLPEEMSLITEMGQVYKRLVEEGLKDRDALYIAYIQTHSSPDRVDALLGSREFRRQMSFFIGRAVDLVELVIREHFRPLRDRLALHSTIANCLDPVHLLKLASTDPGAHASHLEFRRHFEARRNLAIAMQIYAIEKYDPEYWIAKDLEHIEALCWERIFIPSVSQTVWFATQVRDADQPIGTIRLAFAKRRINRQKKAIVTKVGQLKIDFMMCRAVQISKNRRFLIYVIDRRKRLFSTLLKLERGRMSRDRRGWKYVVVGVQTGNRVRTATRADAEEFLRFTQEKLWVAPLFPEEDTSPPNPDSDERYWDRKIIGRLHRTDNGRVVCGSTEQLVTTIRDHLNDKFTRTKRNHEMYRHLQVLGQIGPLWFPNTRDHLKALKSVRLPGYAVDWHSKEVNNSLWNWWLSQL